jgi:hypothetical protein
MKTNTTNILLIKESRQADKTLLHFIVESADSKSDIATGIETLRDEGNSEIRSQLSRACIARLESVYAAKLESIFPVEGTQLPDADSVSLGSYRDGIAANA